MISYLISSPQALLFVVFVLLTKINFHPLSAGVPYGQFLRLLRSMDALHEFTLSEAVRIAWVSGSFPGGDRSCFLATSWYHPRAEGRCPLVHFWLRSARRIIYRTGVSVIIRAVDLREW